MFPEAIMAINASSLQDKKIAISVPIEIYFLIYKSAPKTLVPHCGIRPNMEPNNGPICLLFINNEDILSSINDKMT